MSSPKVFIGTVSLPLGVFTVSEMLPPGFSSSDLLLCDINLSFSENNGMKYKQICELQHLTKAISPTVTLSPLLLLRATMHSVGRASCLITRRLVVRIPAPTFACCHCVLEQDTLPCLLPVLACTDV